MNAFSESTGDPLLDAAIPRLRSVIACLASVIPRLDRRIQGYTAFHQILAPILDAAIKSRHDRIIVFPIVGKVIPPLRYVIPRLDRGIQEGSAFPNDKASSLDTCFRRYNRAAA